MTIKPIKNNADHAAALKRIESLWDAPKGSTKSNELEILTILVDDYEQKHHAILPPDPIEAIKFRMEQMGLKSSDLALYVGGRNRSSEILKRTRNLSVSMMRKLHSKLSIPAESLLADPMAHKPSAAKMVVSIFPKTVKAKTVGTRVLRTRKVATKKH
jgi:HTH-type transcriptional regulator/antitoxin HigA